MSEIIYLYLYIFCMFYFCLACLRSLLLINQKEYIKFRKETYVLLNNLNEIFDIADQELIENLDVKEINDSLINCD